MGKEIKYEIKRKLESSKEIIIDILQEIEPKNVALEEFELAVLALSNNDKYINRCVDSISVYLPMNLPLYSLIIYAVIPKICSNYVYYRPSTKTLNQSKKIHDILNLDSYSIQLFEGTRHDYFKSKVNKSDVVVFVGNPSNANQISEKLSRKTLFIYFGVGQNPVIISSDADIELASEKIAKTVMFNSGQDCAKPNVILCNKKIYPLFKEKLVLEIEKNMHQITDIKRPEAFKKITELLIDDQRYIEYGGTIDLKNNTLNPIIIVKDLKDDIKNYEEYYAPIFRIMLYDNITELKKYFSNQKYKEESMNISLFGSMKYVENLPLSLILHNEMVPEIDNGYCEYGGYGDNTSYLKYNGIKINKPLLINREINYFYDNKNIINSTVDALKSQKVNLKKILFNEYKKFVNLNFSDNLLFSYIFGSYAKGRENKLSDVDMLICLCEKDKKMLERFRKWYFEYHYMYGKIPDFDYPGEVLTEDKLLEIIDKNKNIEFGIQNSCDVFDSLFYTQIFTDKKREILGNYNKLLKYEKEFKKYVPEFCNQIFYLLKDKDLIASEREYMKCLMALASDDLLFFGRKLNFDLPKSNYDSILNEIDDGFLVKCLKRKQGK